MSNKIDLNIPKRFMLLLLLLIALGFTLANIAQCNINKTNQQEQLNGQ